LSRRQKFFVQKALSRISAVSRVVVSLKTRHRRNARAGKEGCGENKEWERVFSLSSNSLTTSFASVVEEKERESILFVWWDEIYPL
jgi:hypothetical protein